MNTNRWPSCIGLHIYKYKDHFIQKPSIAYDLLEAKKFQELNKHLKFEEIVGILCVT